MAPSTLERNVPRGGGKATDEAVGARTAGSKIKQRPDNEEWRGNQGGARGQRDTGKALNEREMG